MHFSIRVKYPFKAFPTHQIKKPLTCHLRFQAYLKKTHTLTLPIGGGRTLLMPTEQQIFAYISSFIDCNLATMVQACSCSKKQMTTRWWVCLKVRWNKLLLPLTPHWSLLNWRTRLYWKASLGNSASMCNEVSTSMSNTHVQVNASHTVRNVTFGWKVKLHGTVVIAVWHVRISTCFIIQWVQSEKGLLI